MVPNELAEGQVCSKDRNKQQSFHTAPTILYKMEKNVVTCLGLSIVVSVHGLVGLCVFHLNDYQYVVCSLKLSAA